MLRSAEHVLSGISNQLSRHDGMQSLEGVFSVISLLCLLKQQTLIVSLRVCVAFSLHIVMTIITVAKEKKKKKTFNVKFTINVGPGLRHTV